MTAFDEGLLSPVTSGHDDLVRDAAVLDALVRAERALIAAYAEVGMLSDADHEALARSLGDDEEPGAEIDAAALVDVASLIDASAVGGNPVIPLVAQLRARVPEELRQWVHRGATSQDVLDTTIMIVALASVEQMRRSLVRTLEGLRGLAERHGEDVVAARTLTQHAVPTTFGHRVRSWMRSIDRALMRLATIEFPAQLAGAAGTGASFVEITGSREATVALVESFARHAGLETSSESWQATRWPVTELGDALVQVVDALGRLATDVATLSRSEIGELAEGAGGGSSAMPQKQNPVHSVLIRSAALRAPNLGATLHLSAALAGDERPDGAWHAEWPTLRELLRLALGAAAHAASLAENLQVDAAAASRNLGSTGGLVISERLAIVLRPLIGSARFDELIGAASGGDDLGERVRALPEAAGLDVDRLLDPAEYLGLAGLGEGEQPAPPTSPEARA
nr:lyase family protein [uncultured Microbacterium sp.]